MFDYNFFRGSGCITCQIRGRFIASQPSDPHTASRYVVSFTHAPHPLLAASSLRERTSESISTVETNVFKDRPIDPLLFGKKLREVV